MRGARTKRALAALVLIFCLCGPAAAEDAVNGFAVSVGAFNVLNAETSTEGGIEIRFRPLWEGGTLRRPDAAWVLRPAAGGVMTSEGAVYGYAGFRLEIPLAGRWTLVPQTGAGVYDRGDDKDLGGSIQFRSGLELNYRLGRENRLGLVFYHLSNAGFDETNPGAESLILQWSWGR